MFWIGKMVPRDAVAPGLPHRVLQVHLNVEQTREVEDGKHQQQDHGRNQGKLQDGGAWVERISRAPGSQIGQDKAWRTWSAPSLWSSCWSAHRDYRHTRVRFRGPLAFMTD